MSYAVTGPESAWDPLSAALEPRIHIVQTCRFLGFSCRALRPHLQTNFWITYYIIRIGHKVTTHFLDNLNHGVSQNNTTH